MTQRRRCTLADARARYASAMAFVDVADRLAAEAFDPDVVVTNAVHAGIAASDSLCCLHLGERSTDQDHGSAVTLLARIDKPLANELSRLLSLKTTAAYETRHVSRTDAKQAVRRARNLVVAAGAALARS
jgi:hypothetical protein